LNLKTVAYIFQEMIYTEYNGDGDIDDIYLEARGRYVRIYCMQRATQYGNSIFELGVYPKGGIAEPTPPGVEILVGDINRDGKINSMDLGMLNRHILKLVILDDNLKLAAADIDGNGNINSTDYSWLKNIY